LNEEEGRRISMSKSVNKVLLLGNVGKDPEVHHPYSGIVVNLSLATNESFKDGRGDWQERVEWHNLVAFQRNAEIIRDYVRKGSRIFIEGKLRTNSWDDKQSRERRYKKEIVVIEVSLLSSGSSADHTNARHEDDGADDFPQYTSYPQGEITRAEVPY
jgi:single-strand DNA-binding protein